MAKVKQIYVRKIVLTLKKLLVEILALMERARNLERNFGYRPHIKIDAGKRDCYF